MPCSAVECRREGTSLPVSIVRPVLDTSEYSSRSKYTDSYLRRSSLSKTSEKNDYARYSTTRMLRETKLPLLSSNKVPTVRKVTVNPVKAQPTQPDKKTTINRSAALSRSEESSGRAGRDSSRVRAHSHSESAASITMATRPPRKPVTTFDIAEFRSLYSPESYVVGSSSRSSDYSRSDSAYTSRSESYSRDNSTFSRESTYSRDSALSRDSVSSYSARPPIDTSSLRASRLSSTSASKTNDPPQTSASSSSASAPPEESLQPRIVPKSAVLNTTTSRKETDSRDTNGLNGLRNIGNTCFLNSVVQCLSNTRLLKDYLINKEYLPDVSNSDSRGALIKSFAEVILELWGGEGRIVNTSAFKSQVQKYAPRFMGYSQQDAQEFLRYLLQGIHDDINRVVTKPRNLPPVNDDLPDSEKAVESWRQYLRYDDSRIVDLFVGQLKSTLRCTVCGHCSTTFEVFWDLSLPLPSRTGTLRLSQCLEHFTKEEVLDGDEMPTCCKCKTRRKCTKSFSIYKFPKILVLHLKRFSPSERYRKLSATVEFPLTGLDMSGYGSSSSSPSYNLYAVSNHSGTAYSGHYTAYCMHPHAHTWHEYNDSRVSSISARNVVSSEAYILFYEQANASNTVTTSRL